MINMVWMVLKKACSLDKVDLIYLKIYLDLEEVEEDKIRVQNKKKAKLN